ncbi:MAG: YgiT-type zinc finger protein [Candidatus Omnitrophota bacterium]
MKKCYFCKGEIIEKEISHVHAWEDKLILFKQTPAEVCKQCGEIYIRPEVASAFDNATEHSEKIKQTIQIPVIPYAELANI